MESEQVWQGTSRACLSKKVVVLTVVKQSVINCKMISYQRNWRYPYLSLIFRLLRCNILEILCKSESCIYGTCFIIMHIFHFIREIWIYHFFTSKRYFGFWLFVMKLKYLICFSKRKDETNCYQYLLLYSGTFFFRACVFCNKRFSSLVEVIFSYNNRCRRIFRYDYFLFSYTIECIIM